MVTPVGEDNCTRTGGYGKMYIFDGGAISGAFQQYWSQMEPQQKLSFTRLFRPIRTVEFSNISTIGQHEAIVNSFDFNGRHEYEATHMWLGTGNNTAPQYKDRSLNNVGYRGGITRYTHTNNELTATLFLDSNEANDMKQGDNYIREIGLATGSDPSNETTKLLNHALVPPELKNPQVVISIEMTLLFEPKQGGNP